MAKSTQKLPAYFAIQRVLRNRKSSLTSAQLAAKTGFSIKTIQNELALGVGGVGVTGKKGRFNLYGSTGSTITV